MAIVPAILSSIASIGGVIGANNANQNIMNRQLNFSREMMHYQNDWNLAQWNRQNEYNSPVNQVHRMKQAGLNPALFYGQGTPGNAGSVTSASPAGYQAPAMQNIMQGVDTFGKMYNWEATKQNINLQRAQENLTKEQAKVKSMEFMEEVINSKHYTENAKNVARELKARADKAGVDSKQAQSALDRFDKETPLILEKYIKEIDNYDKQWKELEARVKNYQQLRLNHIESRKRSQAERGKIDSQIQNIDQNTLLQRMQTEKEAINAQIAELERWARSEYKVYGEKTGILKDMNALEKLRSNILKGLTNIKVARENNWEHFNLMYQEWKKDIKKTNRNNQWQKDYDNIIDKYR